MRLPKLTRVEADILFLCVGQHFVGQGKVNHTKLFDLMTHDEEAMSKAIISLERKGLLTFEKNEKQENTLSVTGILQQKVAIDLFGYNN